MSKQISTRTVIIFGKQGGGKTLFGVLLSCDYMRESNNPLFKLGINSPVSRIHGNVSIYKGTHLLSTSVTSTDNLTQFEYSPIPGVIIFDEMGLNFNSKNHASKKNASLSEFFFLVRKYNLSSIFISQRFGSVPVDMRELADYIFEIASIHRKNNHPLFKVTRYTVDGEGLLIFEQEYIFDIISYLQNFKIDYNTLESSVII